MASGVPEQLGGPPPPTPAMRLPGLRDMHIHNWARTYSCRPAVVFDPTTEDEIRDVLAQARYHSARVRVLGAAHSPSDIAFTSDFLIRLDGFNRLLTVRWVVMSVSM